MNTYIGKIICFVTCFLVNPLCYADIYAFDFKGQCLTTEFDNFVPRSESDEWAQTAFPNYRELGEKARMAKFNLQQAYDFFNSQYNWRSIDNRDTDILLFANFAGVQGEECDSYNAYFYQNERSAAEIAILTGHPNAPTGIGHDLDVVAHEYGHGIYNASAGGDGHFVGAALNEAVADIVGVTVRAWFESNKSLNSAVVRANTFELGEHFMRNLRMLNPNIESDFLRDISGPQRHGGLDHTSQIEPYMRSQSEPSFYDVGGVPALAYVLMVEGGSHPTRSSETLPSMGFKTSFDILMYVVKNRIPFNDIEDFANAMAYAAENIHGAGSQQHINTVKAFNIVGVPIEIQLPPVIPTPAPTPSPETMPQTNVPSQPVPPAQPDATLPQGPALSLNGPMVMMMLGGIVMVLTLAVVLLSGRREKQVAFEQQNVSPQPVVSQPQRRQFTTQESTPVPGADVVNNATFVVYNTEVAVNGIRTPLQLNENGVVFGRQSKHLPPSIATEMAKDNYMSREHANIAYFANVNELKVTCLSGNGLIINGKHKFSQGEKGRISLSSAVSILMGKTEVVVSSKS